MMNEPRMPREEYGIVLDFLQHGHSFSGERGSVAQLIGEKYLVLLEVVPRKDVFLKPGDKVYLGPDRRDQIHHIAGRIRMDKLTQTARMELKAYIENVVNNREKDFVAFFNKCGPISTRLHTLEILPGIGKKHMWDIINARKEKPFESFADIRERVKLIPDPKQSIIKRIIEELEESDKYNILVGQEWRWTTGH